MPCRLRASYEGGRPREENYRRSRFLNRAVWSYSLPTYRLLTCWSIEYCPWLSVKRRHTTSDPRINFLQEMDDHIQIMAARLRNKRGHGRKRKTAEAVYLSLNIYVVSRFDTLYISLIDKIIICTLKSTSVIVLTSIMQCLNCQDEIN